MKHGPDVFRVRPPLHGLSHTRKDTMARTTALIVGAILYVAGLFTGAIFFGELLLTLHR